MAHFHDQLVLLFDANFFLFIAIAVIFYSNYILFKKNLNSFTLSKDNHPIQYLKNILVIHLAKKKKIHYLSTMGRDQVRAFRDLGLYQVRAFRDLGLNNSEIAQRLGCSRKKVINAINLFNDTGSLSNKKRKSRE